MSDNFNKIDRGVLIARLLHGPIYKEDCDSNFYYNLERSESNINNYLSELGLRMLLNRNDNYAFIAAIENEDEEESDNNELFEPNKKEIKQRPASLLHKQAYGLLATYFLVKLRNFLIEHDNSHLGERAVLERDYFLSCAELILRRERTDKRLQAEVDKNLALFCEQKILVRINSADGLVRFEVKRIINSLIKISQIATIKEQIDLYIKEQEQA